MTEKQAGIPTGYINEGSVYEDSDTHEQAHTKSLSRESFGEIFCQRLKALIENIYNANRGLETAFSCVALMCQLKLDETKMLLTISDLVFCDRTVNFQLVEMFICALINLCVHWKQFGSEPLSLLILNPIPSVKAALEQMWCMWSSAHDDPFLPAERMADCLGLIPSKIRNTGCCPTRVECFGENGFLRGVCGNSLVLKINLPVKEETLAHSSEISTDFVTSFECLLYRIYLFVSAMKKGAINLKTDAAHVNVGFNGSEMELMFLAVRIRLQGLRMATMIYYVLMSSCVKFGIKRFSVTAFPSNASLLRKIGDFVVESEGVKSKHFVITLDKMQTKTLDKCGLTGRMCETDGFPGYYEIDPSFFPNAEKLNDQQAVDERYAEIKRKRIQEQVSEPPLPPTPCLKRKRDDEGSGDV